MLKTLTAARNPNLIQARRAALSDEPRLRAENRRTWKSGRKVAITFRYMLHCLVAINVIKSTVQRASMVVIAAVLGFITVFAAPTSRSARGSTIRHIWQDSCRGGPLGRRIVRLRPGLRRADEAAQHRDRALGREDWPPGHGLNDQLGVHRQLLGTDYERLSGRSYYSWYGNTYLFEKVTPEDMGDGSVRRGRRER